MKIKSLELNHAKPQLWSPKIKKRALYVTLKVIVSLGELLMNIRVHAFHTFQTVH